MLEAESTQLAVAIREAVTERRLNGSIAILKRSPVKRRDWTLKYHDNFGFANFEPKRSDLHLWDPNEQDDFQRLFARNSQAFQSLAKQLGPKASQLERFARSICSAAFQGLDDVELKAQVTSFCHQLEDKPIPVNFTAFLDGLLIKSSPLRPSNAITLRRPLEDDLAQEILDDGYGGSHFPLSETWFRVIGEFAFDAANLGDAQREFLRTIEALRLFRQGGVATNRYRIDSRHFMGGGILFGPQRRSRFTYTLTKSDVTPLAEFLKVIVPILPDPFQMDKATGDVDIAHARYVDALFQMGTPDRTIASAVSALEALFLKGEPELTHRLAQRSAMFLKFLGPERDATVVYSNIVKGYKIRSIFVHGGSLKAKDLPLATTLAPVVLEYARRCVLARLQLQSSISKDDLLTKLDASMIDSSVGKNVKQILRRAVWH